VGLATGSNLTVEVYDQDAECRRVKFHGPVMPDPMINAVNPRRCLNNTAMTCTQDSDCGLSKCLYFLPLISTNLLAATCAIPYLSPVSNDPDPSPVLGVFDLETGEMDMTRLNISVAVYLGSCPECRNDPSSYDGMPGGTCWAGDPTVAGSSFNSGVACDVSGVGTAVATTTSYECPPYGLPNIPHFPTNPVPLTTIALPGTAASTGTHAWTMDPSTRPLCTASFAVGRHCWCGICTDGSPCERNSDCSAGNCGFGSAGNFPVANSECGSGGSCNWDDTTQVGTCSNMPQHCYPDTGTIVATGTAEVKDGYYNSQIANFTCLPSVGGSGLGKIIDSTGGFPGPLLFQARFKVTARKVAAQ
jgi:hypothetical protein